MLVIVNDSVHRGLTSRFLWLWFIISLRRSFMQEFLRPIITPYELEIALDAGRSWTGEYVLDFEKVLSESKGQTGIFLLFLFDA